MSSTVPTIYTGFWIDWSRGSVLGSTLTLSAENSAFLVAFIALFVRFVGGQLWEVLAFLLSTTRSTAEPQDAIYHQQQAILRNTSQPLSVLWGMLKLTWFWKDTTTRAQRRAVAFILGSLAYVVAFAVASIFSSKISSADSEVLLLSGPNCGFWSSPDYESYNPAEESIQHFMMKNAQVFSTVNRFMGESHVYVAQCYNSTSTSPTEFCLPYGKDRISWSTLNHTTCPFEDMCIADAIQFDTGFLNSRTHLGINTRHEHIEYRRVMTCAPITTENHVSGYVDANETGAYAGIKTWEDETFLKFFYGQCINYNNNDNTTFVYSNLSFGTEGGSNFQYVSIYAVGAEISCAPSDDPNMPACSTFAAIPSLSQPNADTVLLFLSLNATYLSEVNDPWFRSTIPGEKSMFALNNTEYPYSVYTADNLVNVVACSEQHQLRNPTTGETSHLGGLEVLMNRQAQELMFSHDQMAIFDRSLFMAPYFLLNNIVASIDSSKMLASAGQAGGVLPGLPDNQWQLELEHWFGVALNAIQLWSLHYVSNPPELHEYGYIIEPTEDFAKEMCANQIVRRTDYRSFSVLGMAIVFVFGSLFVVINLIIRPIMELIQRNTIKGRYRNAEWQANDFLQLQRMAYQHDNVGTWTGEHDLVPRTQPGEIFTIPASTKWNEGVSQVPGRDANKQFQSLAGGWSEKGNASQVASTDNIDSSSDKEPVVTCTGFEKKFQIHETPIKT